MGRGIFFLVGVIRLAKQVLGNACRNLALTFLRPLDTGGSFVDCFCFKIRLCLSNRLGQHDVLIDTYIPNK